MELHYFPETDTLSIGLDEIGPVVETLDGPKDDFLLEFDAEDRLVSLTVEHASRRVPLEALRHTPSFRVIASEEKETVWGRKGKP